MRAPFQRLISAANRDNAVTKIVAASGGSLSVFDGASGSLLSRWTNHLQNDDGRPPKKRKTSNGESTVETSTSASAPGFESKARNGPLLGDSSQSFITSLIHTADGRNVVASTAEDKSIYVFELHQDGRLSQLSRRQMAKRPCAITLTPNEKDVICADRFGDVYSLPLLWDPGEPRSDEATAKAKPDMPRRRLSADLTTVHTKKNVAALKAQQKLKPPSEPKEPIMDFEHDYLLGHVSMLTDVAMAEVSLAHGKRQYIFTADRDEHIRLSRGPPQSYVTEGFLLEHEEVVNKLHIPCWDGTKLLSGGGDPYLILWDWLAGDALQKVNVESHVHAGASPRGTGSGTIDEAASREGNIMVTHIQSANIHGKKMVFVSFEAVPKLLVLCKEQSSDKIVLLDTILAPANVIGFIICDDGTLLCSVDMATEPWTRDTRSQDASRAAFMGYQYDSATHTWAETNEDARVEAMNNAAKENVPNEDGGHPRLKDLLYGCENMRKKRHGGGADDDVGAEEGVEEN